LHLGNARTFLVNYLLAVQNGWRVLMRVEDLDGPRVKKGAAQQMLEELAWLGLSWVEPVVYQSARAAAYQAALDQLIAAGWAYPCTCTRKDVETAGGAPQAGDGAVAYPNTCRGRFASVREATEHAGRPAAWRVKVDEAPIAFVDGLAGRRECNLLAESGDFVIFKTDGLAAYQLAVVVDDAAAGVDSIIRGDDLLDSAGRQIHLRRLLGLAPEPRYWHLPLVVGPDGRRLAKRHGDTRVDYYRPRGCTKERMLGLLAHWCGIFSKRQEADMTGVVERFSLARLPRHPIVFCKDDDDFLLAK
jgi:glutamyl-tRNA synthetase